MGMSRDNNAWVEGEALSLAAGTARTSNGSGAPVPTGKAHTARVTLDVTAVSGTTPSATVTIETSEDGSSWRSLGAFTAATAVGKQRRSFSGLDRLIRATWAITGTTPSLTFSVSGELV